MSYKVIFHIDLNAFFASASQLLRPEFNNKPLVVCRNTRSAVVTTASYEAREFGVKSAMPLVMAKGLCPHLIVVEPDFSYYQELSTKFIEQVKLFSNKIEKASIDECYVDVTDEIKTYRKPLDLAIEMQQTILNKLGLRCSIGIGPNKFLAKMASDFKKPMGITVLRKREVETKLWPLPISAMIGVGQVSQGRLKKAGIHTIGDLALADLPSLFRAVEPNLLILQQRARGEDSQDVEVIHTIKSISSSNSLPENVGDYQMVLDLIYHQCLDIDQRRQKNTVYGSSLTINVDFDNGQSASMTLSKDDLFGSFDDIYQYALLLYDQVVNDQLINYLGFTLNKLVPIQTDTLVTLFNYHQMNESIDDVIDKVNSYFKKAVVKKGV